MIYKIDKSKLTDKQILEILDQFKKIDLPELIEKEQYFKGRNPFIANRSICNNATDAPDWRIPVSYARKIINTITGYMFKPGNINYKIKNEIANAKIIELNKLNKEDVNTSQLGKIYSIFGVGYELFYTDSAANVRWANVNVKEIIPLYSKDIEPTLLAFIRFYDDLVDVYYNDVIEHWKFKKAATEKEKDELVRNGEDTPNVFTKVGPPLVVYKNNEELIGDFEHIIKLIDAYDILMSDAINEEERFAWSYLLLSQTMNAEQAAKFKEMRAFMGLGEKDKVEFLTKDIPTAYFEFMQKWIKREIHEQSHVPDFLDMSTGGTQSGVAMDRLLYDFEFICSTKEAFFKEGLYDRFRMIDAISDISESQFVNDDIEIVMNRNRPSDNLANAQIFNQYLGKGITTKKLIQNFAPFVKDVEKEMADFEEETANQMELYPLVDQTNNGENINDTSGKNTGADEQVQSAAE